MFTPAVSGVSRAGVAATELDYYLVHESLLSRVKSVATCPVPGPHHQVHLELQLRATPILIRALKAASTRLYNKARKTCIRFSAWSPASNKLLSLDTYF